LITCAHDPLIQMDPVERRQIIEYLEEEKLPEKPTDEVRLMKEFVSSALSINQPPHRIRNRLRSILGEISRYNTIDLCLYKLFGDPDFRVENNWMPHSLAQTANRLQKQILKEDSFKKNVLTTIESIALTMQRELSSGLDRFYDHMSDELSHGPEQTWTFLKHFTSNISGVGPVLMSDFLKNIGFVEFAKIDQRLKTEFPKLASGLPTTPDKIFIYIWHLCKKMKMSPFVFDYILYQWGNHDLNPLYEKKFKSWPAAG